MRTVSSFIKLTKFPQKSLAILNMIMAAAFFSMMGVKIKSLHEEIPTFELLFARCIFGSFFIAVILRRKKIKLKGIREKELYFRAIIGFISAACFFYSMGRMKISDASVLVRSSALFVPFVAFFVAKENVRSKDLLSALIGFLGVGLIIKPGTSVFTSVSLVALLAAFTQSVAFASVRNLSKSEHPLRIVFYFLSVSSILSLIFGYTNFVLPNNNQILKICIISFSGLIGQYFMTTAYSKSTAAAITPVLNVEIVFTTITAMIVFGEFPDIFSWLGMSIIILSTLHIKRKK
jgi:drug/metabolite transporter (DMT)-like permease